MNIWRLSWKSLTHRPLALILSLLLFALGVGLISFLFVMEKQLQENFEKNLAEVDLVIGAKGSPLQMILSSMYHIDAPTGNISLEEVKAFLNPKHPLIKEVVPLSLGDSYRGYRIVGSTHNILSWYEAQIGQGKIWTKDFEVTIGAAVADKLDLTIGDQFKSSHGLEDAEGLEHDDAESFTVVGILQQSGSVIDQLILTTPQSFWLVHDHDHTADESTSHNEEDHDHDDDNHDDHDHEHDHGNAHDHHDHDDDEHSDHDHESHQSVRGITPQDLLSEEMSKEVTSLLVRFKGRNFQALNMQRSINENTDLQAATPAIEINRLFAMMNSGERALRLLAIVIIIVSGFSIFISLYSSLHERKYELALMRSMGASRNTIFAHIIIEGLIISVIGYVIGLILSHLSMEMVSRFMDDTYRYQFSGWQFLRKEWWLLVGSVGIGLIAALLPAIQASKTDIADTLTGK